MMINIFKHNDTEVIDSHELFMLIGMNSANYSRWMLLAKSRGGRDIDWFISSDLLAKNKKIKSRCYFSLEFARAMCMRYRTDNSHKLIVYLKR